MQCKACNSEFSDSAPLKPNGESEDLCEDCLAIALDDDTITDHFPYYNDRDTW